MPEMWMDVDVGLAEVPMNLLPLIDDTDFKAIETGIVYNSAGMDLVWNFISTAGAFTQTAVTPTTGGDYDWVHQGDGMYSIEIPASGGASINNDAEGFGWFKGFVTGVLPWHSPVIGIRAAAINDALIDGGDNLDVNTVQFLDEDVTLSAGNKPDVNVEQWLEQAVTLSAGNKPDVNVNEVSDDSVAADNLEAGWDGTGVTGGTFPATQAQVGNIASGTAATNTVATSATVTTGSEVNTFADTVELDGTVHEVNPDTGNTEFYYEFSVGANGVPVSVLWEGYANNPGNSYAIYARNWAGASWQQVGTIPGTPDSTVIPLSFDLTTAHVGTGANIGLVRWRVLSANGTGFNTDRILCSFATVSESVGYADGAIWYDDSASNTGVEPFLDGTADNPVSSWTAVKSLISSVGLNRVRVANGSEVILDANSDSLTLVGDNWDLALGTQSIVELVVRGAHVTGVGTAASGRCHFADCNIGAATLPPSIFVTCGIGESSGQFTAGSDGEYVFDRCYSMAPGSATPVLVFTGLGSATGINNRGWKGGSAYTLDSDCTLSHEVLAGGGQSITTGGADVELRGICRAVTFVLSAAETVQFAGVTGPIILSGTTTATVNLYGVSSGPPADTTSAADVTDDTVHRTGVADETLKRGVSNVEDAADTTSLAALILGALESSVSGTTWTIRKTGGTTFVTKTLTVDSGADPITGVT